MTYWLFASINPQQFEVLVCKMLARLSEWPVTELLTRRHVVLRSSLVSHSLGNVNITCARHPALVLVVADNELNLLLVPFVKK